MSDETWEKITVVIAVFALAAVLYFGIPWAIREPIYCGDVPCSEVGE